MKKELQKLEQDLKEYFESEKFKKSVANHTKSAPETIDALNEIKHQMKDGFDGTHERLDRTDKKVSKNTNWRLMITGALIFTNILLIPMAFILFSKIVDQLIN